MTTLLGIAFDFMGMTYYRTSKNVEVGNIVIVETPHGTYPGKVLKVRIPTEEEANKPNFNTVFPEIERIATFSDMDFARKSVLQGEKISKATQQLADQLKLNMKVLKSYLDIDEDKVLVTFTSDARVDFRELVRLLGGTFHLKIELRQIGPRDQAKLVGGLGPCGLPLCCSTFLKSFDGISISMAKNQLLSINIPKLSGQCGKLMCCLKYEDEAYSKLRPLYPKVGEKFDYNNKTYEVTGLNLLIGNITTYNGDSYETFTKEEFERVKKGLSKVDESKMVKGDLNSGVDLSGHGLKDTINRISQIEKNEKKHRDEVKDKFSKPTGKNQNQKNFNKPNTNGKNGGNPKNGNHSFNGKNSHSFNSNHKNNHSYNSNAPKKETGFIPVSELAGNSAFDFIPVKKNDKK
jgi:cell fate regulator YaaT (PSP1 superfamily)